MRDLTPVEYDPEDKDASPEQVVRYFVVHGAGEFPILFTTTDELTRFVNADYGYDVETKLDEWAGSLDDDSSDDFVHTLRVNRVFTTREELEAILEDIQKSE